jgi:hypothetical protein
MRRLIAYLSFPEADFWLAWFSRGSTSKLSIIRGESFPLPHTEQDGFRVKSPRYKLGNPTRDRSS